MLVEVTNFFAQGMGKNEPIARLLFILFSPLTNVRVTLLIRAVLLKNCALVINGGSSERQIQRRPLEPVTVALRYRVTSLHFPCHPWENKANPAPRRGEGGDKAGKLVLAYFPTNSESEYLSAVPHAFPVQVNSGDEKTSSQNEA
jgi:hypothetical protein